MAIFNSFLYVVHGGFGRQPPAPTTAITHRLGVPHSLRCRSCWEKRSWTAYVALQAEQDQEPILDILRLLYWLMAINGKI